MKIARMLAALAAVGSLAFTVEGDADPITDATAAGLVPGCTARVWAQRGYQGDAALTARNFRDAFSRAAGACVGVDYRVAARLLCSRDRVVGSLCAADPADEPVTTPPPPAAPAQQPPPPPVAAQQAVIVEQRGATTTTATSTTATTTTPPGTVTVRVPPPTTLVQPSAPAAAQVPTAAPAAPRASRGGHHG